MQDDTTRICSVCANPRPITSFRFRPTGRRVWECNCCAADAERERRERRRAARMGELVVAVNRQRRRPFATERLAQVILRAFGGADGAQRVLEQSFAQASEAGQGRFRRFAFNIAIAAELLKRRRTDSRDWVEPPPAWSNDDVDEMLAEEIAKYAGAAG